MNKTLDEQRQNRREKQILIVLAFLLVLAFCISKFALGINFGLLEKGYQSFGYREIKGIDFWSLTFGSFTGEVHCTGTLNDSACRKILIHSGSGSSNLWLDIDCAGETTQLQLNKPVSEAVIPGHAANFELRLSGENVTSGSFNAVWNE